MATREEARQHLIEDFDKETVVHLLCNRIDGLRDAATALFSATRRTPGSEWVSVKEEHLSRLRETLLEDRD